MRRSARALVSGIFFLLPLLLLPPTQAFSAPADSVSSVTASATFDGDTPNAPPNLTLPGSPVGDSLTISESSGTVRVRTGVGTLASKPVEMNQVPGIGGLNMHVYPVAVSGCDRATVRWRSLARADTICFLACVLRDPGGAVMASVEYRPGGVLTFNSVGGPLTPLPVSYTPDIDQQFTVELDFAAQTSSVSADGVALAGFQNVPFPFPGSALGTIGFEGGCTVAQDFAVDEISAVALCGQDDPPTLLAPAVVNGEEGGSLGFSVSASDPDGDPIGTLTADLSGLPPGGDATFTVNESSSAGVFLWHPMVGDSGAYTVVFSAVNALTTTATTQINVGPAGTSVTGTLVWVPQPGREGVYDVVFTASNPAGEAGSATTHITVTSSPAAVAPVTAHAPQAAQLPQKGPIVRAPAGVSVTVGDTVVVVVTATDADEVPPPPPPPSVAGSPTRASAITVTTLTLTADLSQLPPGNNATFTVDHQPEVAAPSTVYATVGTTVSIHITASDPDGDPILAISADTRQLPPGNGATFATDMHTTGDLTWHVAPGQEGTYPVTFSSSNALTGKTITTIVVSTALQARAFMPGQTKKIKLATLRPGACLQIEPIGAFTLYDIDFGSIVMISPGTGSVSEISTASRRHVVVSDKDENGQADATVCFGKEDLRQIFSLLSGTVQVPVAIEGNLIDNRRFHAEITLEVIAAAPKLAAQVAPNPLNPTAILTVTTTRSGRLSVSLYDLGGRLVRKLHDDEVEAGEHAIRIDGRSSSGAPLAAGVYFYSVEAAEGRLAGRFMILK